MHNNTHNNITTQQHYLSLSTLRADIMEYSLGSI